MHRPTPRRIIGLAVALLILLFLWLQETTITFFSVGALRRLDPHYPLEQAFSLIFLAYLVFLLFSSALFTLNALMLHPDLDLLLAAPWPVGAVVGGKVLTQVLTLLGGSLLFTLPLLVVTAVVLRHPIAVIALLASLAVYPVIPVVGITVLVLALIRFVPASRARELMAAVGLLLAFGINAFNLFFNPGLRGGRTRSGLTFPNVPLADSAWLPWGWAGRTAAAALAGDWVRLLEWGGLLVAASALVFVMGTTLGGRLYISGWAQSSPQPARGHPARHAMRLPQNRLSGLGQPVAAVIIKDWRVRSRDVAQLIRLLMPVGFVAALLIVRGGGSLALVRGLGPGPLAAMAATAPVWLLVLALSQGLGLTAVSLEGKAFWIFQTSPNSMRRLLEAKCWAVALPTVLLAVGAGLAFEGLARPGWIWAAGAIALVAVFTAAICALMVAVGSVWARFDWSDARRMVHPIAGLVAILAQAALAALTAVLVILPVGLAWAFNLPMLPLWLLGILAACGAALALAVAALLAAERRLLQLEVG